MNIINTLTNNFNITSTRFTSLDVTSNANMDLINELSFQEIDGETIVRVNVRGITIFSDNPCTILLNGTSRIRLHPGFGLEIDEGTAINSLVSVDAGIHFFGIARATLTIKMS